MAKKTDAPEPMDPSVHENKTPVVKENTQRVCWALQTLVAEVEALFPQTPVEYSNYDGRNTALDATFDLTALDDGDRSDMLALMSVYDFDLDARIESVIAEDASVLVSFKASARTQDRRDPFGLADALDILAGGDTEDRAFSDPSLHAHMTALAGEGSS